MRIQWVRTAWAATLCGILLCVLIVQWGQFGVLKHMARDIGAQTVTTGLTTTWKSGGQTISVHTDPEIGESDAALLVRHTELVKKKLVDYPIDR